MTFVALQIQFSELINPSELTMGLAVILAAIMLGTLWAGFKLRHASILFMFMVQLFVFVFSILTNLSFLWFWITVLLSGITIAMIGSIRQLIG